LFLPANQPRQLFAAHPNTRDNRASRGLRESAGRGGQIKLLLNLQAEIDHNIPLKQTLHSLSPQPRPDLFAEFMRYLIQGRSDKKLFGCLF